MPLSTNQLASNAKPKPPPPPDSDKNVDFLFSSELIAQCQNTKGGGGRDFNNNYAGSANSKNVNSSSGSTDLRGDSDLCCTKVDFLKLLKPKRCKIPKNNSTCCPFGGKNEIKYPICSWFASPRYYHHTCSRSTRPQCCRTKCWYYEQLCCGEEGAAETGEDGNPQEQTPRRKLSTNTLHGVRSVNDLRAWSICCEEQRRYFLEQMLKAGKRSVGEEGELELDADEPSGTSPMERKYENLLRGKEEEIQRLQDRIRELEGQPARPPPSSTRSVPGQSYADIASRRASLSRVQSSGGILSKSKSTTSTKLVTIEDSPPTKESEIKASASTVLAKASSSRTSISSDKSISESAAEGKSGQASATSVGAGSRRESLTKSQKSGESIKSAPSAATSKAADAKSQKSRDSVGSDSNVVSRKSSDAKSRKGSSDSIRSGTASAKASETKTQKSSESVVPGSEPASRRGSETKSQKSATSVKSQPSAAVSGTVSTPEAQAQESSESIIPPAEEEQEEEVAASRTGSETKSQKRAGSVKSTKSSPESQVASEAALQKSSESIAPEVDAEVEEEAVVESSTKASEVKSEKSAATVKSGGSDTKTQKSSTSVKSGGSDTKTQKSATSVKSEGSDTKTQKSGTSVKSGGSDTKTQKSATSIKSRGSDTKTQKSATSVKSAASEVTSQKSTDNAEDEVAAASKTASSIKSQKSGGSVKSAGDESIADEEQEAEASAKPSETRSQKSAETVVPEESTAVSGTASAAATAQKSNETVNESVPASRKESVEKSVKSQKSGGSVRSSKSAPSQTDVVETGIPEASSAASRKSSTASQTANESSSKKDLEAAELEEEGKDSGSLPGSKSNVLSKRSSPQTQAMIPEENEEQVSEENVEAKSTPESVSASQAVSKAASAHSTRTVKDEGESEVEEPDLFEDEPPDEINLDDVHPVTSTEELSEELYFIDPETEGVEITYDHKEGETPDETKSDELMKTKTDEVPAGEPEVGRTPAEEQSQASVAMEDGPKPLTEQGEEDILGGILPLQPNESLSMELSFVDKPKDETSTEISEKITPSKVLKEPQTRPPEKKRERGLSLAEIGGYEERRPKPFVCSSCEEEEKPRKYLRPRARSPAKTRTSTVTDARGTGIRVVVSNNKILKLQGQQVVEEVDPEALLTETDLLNQRLEAQNERIRELEESLYSGYPQPAPPSPNNVEESQIALLREQVLALEAELAERENVESQWYSALEATTEERDAYREEIMRSQVMMQEYERTVAQLEQRLQAVENGRALQFQPIQQPLPQQFQPQQPNYPNYYPGGAVGGRGDQPNHLMCLRR